MNKVKLLATGGVLALGASLASAQTDIAGMITEITDGFEAVAALAILIGTFWIIFRMVKRAR